MKPQWNEFFNSMIARSGKKNAKLTKSDIRRILEARLVNGEPTKSIAERLGFSQTCVTNLANGQNYMALRSEVIKEMRAEGLKVVLR